MEDLTTLPLDYEREYGIAKGPLDLRKVVNNIEPYLSELASSLPLCPARSSEAGQEHAESAVSAGEGQQPPAAAIAAHTDSLAPSRLTS